jgi:hypothetical protein
MIFKKVSWDRGGYASLQPLAYWYCSGVTSFLQLPLGHLYRLLVERLIKQIGDCSILAANLKAERLKVVL